jgi:hypothetical protein
MRPVLTLLAFLLAALESCASAGAHEFVSECDLGIALKATDPDADGKAIQRLFETADESCATNVEFMQILNEAVFNSLENNPRVFLYYYAISANRGFIREQIETPTHDSVDIKRIRDRLSQISPTNQAIYDELMNALRAAEQNIPPKSSPQ